MLTTPETQLRPIRCGRKTLIAYKPPTPELAVHTPKYPPETSNNVTQANFNCCHNLRLTKPPYFGFITRSFAWSQHRVHVVPNEAETIGGRILARALTSHPQ